MRAAPPGEEFAAQSLPRCVHLDSGALENLRELERRGSKGLLDRMIRTFLADTCGSS